MTEKEVEEEILSRLLRIEKQLKKIARKEDEISEKEDEISHASHILEGQESQELKALHKLLGREIKRRFDNIMQWRVHIWETCPDKTTMDYKDHTDFMCRKTGKSCRFVDCYRNKLN